MVGWETKCLTNYRMDIIYEYETFVDGEDNPVFKLDGCTIQDRIIMGGCGLDIE